VLADGVAALLDHLLEHGQHLGVVELDALVHLALLDRGVDQADHAEAGLVAGLHGRLHVFGELLLEGHAGAPETTKAGDAMRAGLRECVALARTGRAISTSAGAW